MFIFITSSVLFASSQNKGFSRWSFAPEVGYNLFNGNKNQNFTNLLPNSLSDIAYGFNIEYALSPIWGLSLDAYSFPIREINADIIPLSINTDLYTSNLNATINFTRWIFPQSKSKLYVIGSIGIGAAYYMYDVRHSGGALDGTSINTETYNDNGNILPIHLSENNAPIKQGIATSVPITFSLEYNFSSPFSIGAKVHYRTFNRDNLEGVTYLNQNGVTNDFITAGTLYLRYKFNSIKKDHLRNIKMNEYEPNEALVLAQEVKKDLEKLKGRVDSIETKVDSLLPRIQKMEALLSNDGPDSDGDGVPDNRDLEPNTPRNTAVDFWGRSSNQVTAASSSNKPRLTNDIPADVPAVYFDFDKIDLDNNALITISKIAAKMKADPSLMLEVRGYCDYMGNTPYNNLLSQRRSDRVKAELVKVWGISFDRIISNGKGKVLEPRTKYLPNRRCDLFFGRL